jgi:hypothetical protein
LENSELLEIQDDGVRLKNDWKLWLLPRQQEEVTENVDE